MENVMRYDHLDCATLTAVKDSNGFMYDTVAMARSGVYTYVTSKGEIRKEYRPVDVVFDPSSLATYEGKPITVDHPKAGKVNSKTAQKLTVGTVLTPGRLKETIYGENDDKYVEGKIVVYNPDAIGDRRELSVGYTCDCEETPGTAPNGENYHAIQRNIKVNHLSIVTKGRAGSCCRLHADGNQVEDFDNAPNEGVVINNPELGNTIKEDARMSMFRIDGADFELDSKVVAHINTLQARLDAKEAEVKAKEAEKEVAEKEATTAKAGKELAEEKLAQLQADCKELSKKVNDAVKAKEQAEAEKAEAMEQAEADKAEAVAKAKEENEEALAEKDEELEEEKNEKSELEDKLDSAESNIIAMKTILEAAQKDMATRKDSMDELQARFDSVSEELEKIMEERDSLQARLDAVVEEKEQAIANAKEAAQKEAQERAELEELAVKAKVDGSKDMSNEDLKKAIIKATRKEFDEEGKSKAYIDAAFDMAKENLRSDSVKEQMNKAMGKTAVKNDSYQTATQRRKAMIDRQLNAFKSNENKC